MQCNCAERKVAKPALKVNSNGWEQPSNRTLIQGVTPLVAKPPPAVTPQERSRKHMNNLNRQMRMKNRIIAMVSLSVLALTIGCDRALVVKTPLGPSENFSKDDAVFVDGTVAGHLKRVGAEGSERIAVLAITEDSARQKMRTGVVRVLDDGKISLRTDSVESQSPLLSTGAMIPVISKTGLAVRQLTSNRMLTGLLVGLAIVAVCLLLFRRLVRGWLLLLTLVLSATSAWLLLPWTASAVSRGYSLLPKLNSGANGAPASVGTSQSLSTFFESPPNPQAVAYAAVFIVAFIVLSVVLRGAFNRLENRG